MEKIIEICQLGISEYAKVAQEIQASDEFKKNMRLGAERILHALRSGSKILACGNGGSMAQAIHLAEELTGRYRRDRMPLPALAISDPGHLSCVANDYGYELVFSRYVEALGRPGDVLALFTTSGHSANLLKAAATAREKGLATLGFTGHEGSPLSSLLDVEVRVPCKATPSRYQEVHLLATHLLLEILEENF